MEEEWTPEQRVLLMALDAFKTTGHDYKVMMGGGEYGISVESIGLELWLTNMIARAVAQPESEWQRHVDRWLTAANDMIAQGPVSHHSEAEILGGIRTRLYPADLDPEGLSYARPFADGLVIGLAIDSPTTVSTVTTKSLPGLGLDVETLFRLGQANTDRESIDEAFEIEEYGCRGLGGESYFVASRAANLATLGEYVGPAPYGVAFGVPNRHALVFKTLDPDNWVDIIAIAQLVDSITIDEDPETNPGGVLSPHLYYWAPDGTVELLGGRLTEMDGEMTLTARPGPAFGRFVLGDR
ncbi:MAG: hypothetical protein V9G04_09935 [Nocardioides sp.]|jgi:hypothetical protein